MSNISIAEQDFVNFSPKPPEFYCKKCGHTTTINMTGKRCRRCGKATMKKMGGKK